MAETKSGASSVPAVDLVVVIDTSASMRDEAVALSEAVSGAIAAAKDHCPSDLRVEYLGVEGTFSKTKFTTTVRGYLTTKAKADPAQLKGRLKGSVAEGGAQEDGALAIEDVTNHFDWRQGAKKAILYLTDEALYGGGLVDQEDIDAATSAINVAKAGEVRVHTYLGTSNVKADERKKLESELARVASGTGGQAFTDKDALGGFQALLEKVICGSRSTPGSKDEAPCEDCGKPEAPPKKDAPPKKEPAAQKEPPAQKETPAPKERPPANDDLYAIVLIVDKWWAAGKDVNDNGDIYVHDPKTGAIKSKLVDNKQGKGKSIAITSDGWRYYIWNDTNVYRERDGVLQDMPSLLINLGYSTEGLAFRQDDRGFMLHAENPLIVHFQHDPNRTDTRHQRLTIKSAGRGPVAPFGSGLRERVTDLAFDGNDRAYLLGLMGDIWVVDDTRSLTEWSARHLCKVPPVSRNDLTRYTGIAFGADGTAYLCGGVIETLQPLPNGRRWAQRFIAKFQLSKPGGVELIYQGAARTGLYSNLTSQAFPKFATL